MNLVFSNYLQDLEIRTCACEEHIWPESDRSAVSHWSKIWDFLFHEIIVKNRFQIMLH